MEINRNEFWREKFRTDCGMEYEVKFKEAVDVKKVLRRTNDRSAEHRHPKK
jgi:hypothetical protein